MFRQYKFGIFILITFALGVISCSKDDISPSNLIPAKGKDIDITGKNSSVVRANVGDILSVTLVGDADKNFQWSFREPISGAILSLEKHTDSRRPSGSKDAGAFVSEWKLKIEKSADFEILFQYENPSISPVQRRVFRAFVVTTEQEKDLQNIIVLKPSSQDIEDRDMFISGYARITDGTLQYELVDEKNTIITSQEIQLTSGNGFQYFERREEVPERILNATLKVFRKTASDELKVDIVEIPLAFN